MTPLLQKIVSILVKWLQPKHKTAFEEDLPEVLANKTIYLIGETTNPWLVAFKCPCGCNNVIQLNLLKDADPRWRLHITSKKKINISPSIWRTNGCKSHFFVRNSKIEWVRSRISFHFD
jgi:hypothetical protein